MQLVGSHTQVFQTAGFCVLAFEERELRQERAFVRIVRPAQAIDVFCQREQSSLLLARVIGATGHARSEHEGARKSCEPAPEPPRVPQSAGRTLGPTWMRSPTYDPISENRTPRADINTYMNAGIIFTV